MKAYDNLKRKKSCFEINEVLLQLS